MELRVRTNNIMWDLLLMLILVSFLDQTVVFILSFLYLIYLSYRNGFKLAWPKITGLNTYILIIFLNMVTGILTGQDLRSIARDIYYFFPTIIWLFISANLFLQEFKHDTMMRTIYLSCLITSIYAFYSFIFNGDLSFNGLRMNMTFGVYHIDFFWILMMYYILIKKEFFFSKAKDIVIFAFCSLQIFLSLGRISMGLPIIGALIILWLNFKENNNKSALKKIVLIIILLVGLGIIAYSIIPKNVSTFFFEKVLNSAQEINSNQVINSTESAMNNWRGYENQTALNQYFDSNLVIQIFGSGLGKGVYVNYVPFSWVGTLQNNTLPLLHNGYYTALIKIGLIGTLNILEMFIFPLLKACSCFQKDKRTPLIEIDIFIIVLSIMSIIFTYIVRGPVQQGVFLGWALLIGYLPKYRDYLLYRN